MTFRRSILSDGAFATRMWQMSGMYSSAWGHCSTDVQDRSYVHETLFSSWKHREKQVGGDGEANRQECSSLSEGVIRRRWVNFHTLTFTHACLSFSSILQTPLVTCVLPRVSQRISTQMSLLPHGEQHRGRRPGAGAYSVCRRSTFVFAV